jgi:hypothetical protein
MITGVVGGAVNIYRYGTLERFRWQFNRLYYYTGTNFCLHSRPKLGKYVLAGTLNVKEL